MMLVQFSRKHNAVTVMSIPRDAWVDIPGHGKAKINAAFAYGGPSLAIETVQDLTGVPIDHFAIVNFETFSALTDALGSVEIETTRGPQQMNGTQALAFVRERKSLPGGDFDRVKRQQAWMRAIMAGIFSEDVLSSPSKTLNLIQTASQDMTLDEGLGTSELLSLAKDARHVRPKDVTFITAPYTGTDTSADGQSIVNLDYEVLQPLAKAWAEDNLPQYLQGAGAGIPQLSKRVN
ncbi:cell envelope-like function transcriptional attenuator common domain protein [Winkia neuii]|nr:cell envelope-like function transcriptional attenuator common domain protein [Winkia neuii]